MTDINLKFRLFIEKCFSIRGAVLEMLRIKVSVHEKSVRQGKTKQVMAVEAITCYGKLG